MRGVLVHRSSALASPVPDDVPVIRDLSELSALL
jgi:hypothetical protein